VTAHTENVTEDKNIALGAFLHTQWALDRTSFDILKVPAERYRIEPAIYR
jgi:hypothetical protein